MLILLHRQVDLLSTDSLDIRWLELLKISETRGGKMKATLEDIAEIVVRSIRSGNKVLIFGVGGNASTASHFAAELAGKYEEYEDPLPVICLNDNTSIITAITNDFGWDPVFFLPAAASANSCRLSGCQADLVRSCLVAEAFRAAC